MGKKLSLKNWASVGERIRKLEKSEQKTVFEALNSALDEIRNDDGFGTEGQLDPRGDGLVTKPVDDLNPLNLEAIEARATDHRRVGAAAVATLETVLALTAEIRRLVKERDAVIDVIDPNWDHSLKLTTVPGSIASTVLWLRDAREAADEARADCADRVEKAEARLLALEGLRDPED